MSTGIIVFNCERVSDKKRGMPSAKLKVGCVTGRPIRQGEEILMDYG